LAPRFEQLQSVLFGAIRDDLPRAAGLDSALREALQGFSGARSTVRVSELFDRLLAYRNREIGHGALGQRPGSFYEQMGSAILSGCSELLARADVLADHRLIAVTEVRRIASGSWIVDREELSGESPRRIEPLEVDEHDVGQLPRPDRVYLIEQAGAPPIERRLKHRGLHPLVLFERETGETFFLNARRGQTRAEYLCYGTGRVINRNELGRDHRELIARVLGGSTGSTEIGQWAERSRADEGLASIEPDGPMRTVGEFELLSELGRGGMGVVYRARQPSLDRQLALKCLLRSGDVRSEARFTREIHALGKVDHPNIVKVYTSGAVADQWFYAMELIEGATLAAVCETLSSRSASPSGIDSTIWRDAVGTACERARRSEKPLSRTDSVAPRPSPDDEPQQPRQGQYAYIERVANLIEQVAEAAHCLHEAGIVHRDIKPANVMVTSDGSKAVLMDLGLAQLADEAQGRLTRTRQFVGTLRYASPEQVRAITQVDRRSDVYSLGATLWELLTLRPLFGATDDMPTPDLMERIQYEEPDRVRKHLPGVAPDLEAIVHKCLKKDPRGRYETAGDLAEDIAHWRRGELVRAQPLTFGSVMEELLRRYKRGPLTRSWVLSLGVINVVALFLWVWLYILSSTITTSNQVGPHPDHVYDAHYSELTAVNAQIHYLIRLLTLLILSEAGAVIGGFLGLMLAKALRVRATIGLAVLGLLVGAAVAITMGDRIVRVFSGL
jgi:serine/threonine protein kinase